MEIQFAFDFLINFSIFINITATTTSAAAVAHLS